MMQKTLIILKPDCVQGKLCGEVIRRFEQSGYRIAGMKMMRLSAEILAEHYAHLTDKPFYPRIQEFMQSSPVVALALEGENAVDNIRTMVGPTDSTKAEKGTIRGDLGKDIQENVVHASDSAESAQAELKRFFTSNEIF